jgi:hypothetical protein
LGRRAGAISIVAIAAAATGASAHPPVPVGASGEPVAGAVHAWLHQAKVPLVRGRLQVLVTGCPGRPGYSGCVITSRPRRIYLSRRALEPRRVFLHELGHVFDLRVMRRAHRRAFMRIMHRRDARWYKGSRPPAEWFADGYELCARRKRIGRRPETTFYGYRPSPRQHRAVCELIERAGAPKRGRTKRRAPAPQPPPTPPPVFHEPPSAAQPPPQQPPPPDGGGGDSTPAPSPNPEPPPGTCDVVERLLTGCRPLDD